MTPERWQKIRDLLAQALSLAPEQRSALLDRACVSDTDLRKEVEILLASNDDVRSSFLQSPPPPPRVALSPGTRLGEYEIKSMLGAGGMGEVYRARDARLGRDVAIKVLPAMLSADADRLRRFEQEARAAAALNHPNILAVFQMGTFEGAPYLVSELLEGETLREQLRRRRIPVRKAVDYGVQIARGLSAAHEKGVVHRDLKPENLFVTKDVRVKILDFGLAKLSQPQGSEHSMPTIGGETEPGAVMGTVGYMSPEQVRGQTADHRADIFAFGAILYEMLAGKRAFQKPTAADTQSAILNEDPPSISQVTTSIPPALQRVLHRCLEKNPEQRFQSASDLAFALDALSDPRPQEEKPFLGRLGKDPPNAHGLIGEGQPRFEVMRRRWLRVVSACLAVLAALAFWWGTPLPDPKILDIYQVTRSARQDYVVRPATDGARIFYLSHVGDHYDLMQVSVNGGEPQRMQAPFPNTLIWDVSPDGTKYLITSVIRRGEPSQLWSWPSIGGYPTKLDDMISGSAIYSPDGNMIAFHIGRELWIANSDGSNKQKLGTFSGDVDHPAWSPDGKKLRFSIADPNQPDNSIWEIRTDGHDLHDLFPGWVNKRLCCGSWTPDGKYYLFIEVGHWPRLAGRIWSVREKGNWPRRSPRGPFLLASEAHGSMGLLLGRDGRHVYYLSDSAQKIDMESLDISSRQLTPFLPGSHSLLPGFSRDGKWVAYLNTVTSTLWRSRLDGTFAQELPSTGILPTFPRWSPNGKALAFTGSGLGDSENAYVVDAEGGRPEPLVPGVENLHDPDWSGDGSQLVVIQDHPVVAGKQVESAIAIVNWQDRSLHLITDSNGMGMPRWSPNGRWIAAVGSESKGMRLYDLNKKSWRSLTQGKSLGLPVWSPDSAYLYFQRPSEPGQPLVRVRVSSGAEETVASFQAAIDSGATTCTFLGLTTTGHPIVNLASASDIFGATLIAP